MTLTARLVLSDCEDALRELIDCDVDPDLNIGPMRRRRWLAILALLRAVGHVLKKVDGESSPTLRRVVDAEWSALIRTKPEPQILWGFIEEERNVIVKEYRFRSLCRAAGVGVTSISGTTASGVVTVKANRYNEAEFRILTDGPFTGRNDVDVVAEAVKWWKAYLDAIDGKTAAIAI